MKKALFLAILGTLSSAQAYRNAENLKGFKTVCVNVGFEEQGEENEAVRGKLITRLEDSLKKAKIPVAPGDCQAKGLTANKQINLYFDFFTTDDGEVYQGSAEGWLSKEGQYSEITLWSGLFIGSLDAGSGSLEAADIFDQLLANFVTDWKKTTH